MSDSYFQSYVRKYNYIQDYFHTVYERYITTYPAYPVNYYAVDRDNTIWHDTEFRGGTYDKNGVGELSGKKFKKILELPVFQLTSIQPTTDSAEFGITTKASLQGSLCIPQAYNLKPTMEDVIDINSGLKNTGNPSKVLYIISNIDYAHYGDEFNIYKCTIQVASFDKVDIETQLSSIWRFYGPSKTIIPASNAATLYKMIGRAEKISTDVKAMYHCNSSLYLDKLYI
jgi:hypothetical protein